MKKGTIRKILIVVTGAVYLFSAGMVAKHHLEMRIGVSYSETMAQMVVVPAPEQPLAITKTEITNQPKTEEPQEFPVEVIEEPVEPAPIQVDFQTLCAENPDVIAWIYCPDTPINYPVAQSSDNEYYLRRLLDGSRNTAGTLFMDFRNAPDLSGWNAVIYGHNLKNSSMFGTLHKYQDQAYYDEHPELYLLTPEQDYVVKLIAGYTTSTDTALYHTFSPNQEDRVRMVESWLEDSDFVSGYTPTEEDRFITLSTCSYAYTNARYVLIGVLKPLGSR